MLVFNTIDEETYSSLESKSIIPIRDSEDHYFQERIKVPNKGLTIRNVILNIGISVGTNACGLLRNIEVERQTQQAVESDTYHMEDRIYMEDQQFFNSFKCKHVKYCEQRSHLPIVMQTKVNVRD